MLLKQHQLLTSQWIGYNIFHFISGTSNIAPFSFFWHSLPGTLWMIPSGTFRFLLAPFGSFWHLSVPFSTFQFLLAPFGSFWHLSVPSGTFRFLLAPFSSFWHLSVPSSTPYLAPFGSFWRRGTRTPSPAVYLKKNYVYLYNWKKNQTGLCNLFLILIYCENYVLICRNSSFSLL